MLAKDSRMRGGREGKGRKGVNAIYTMTTIVPLSFSLSPGAKCPRSAAKGREEGEKSELLRHTGRDRGFRSRARCGGSGRKAGDVCRTRYLANKTTWRRTEHPRVAVRG